MGAFGMSSFDCSGYNPGVCPSERAKAKPTTPNPNPVNFKILMTKQIGRGCALFVNYPDCTTLEGNKILVFKNSDVSDLKRVAHLDPHFSELSNLIARFAPDSDGWIMALELMEIIFDQEVERCNRIASAKRLAQEEQAYNAVTKDDGNNS